MRGNKNPLVELVTSKLEAKFGYTLPMPTWAKEEITNNKKINILIILKISLNF
jgi:hypothetical protein